MKAEMPTAEQIEAYIDHAKMGIDELNKSYADSPWVVWIEQYLRMIHGGPAPAMPHGLTACDYDGTEFPVPVSPCHNVCADEG